METVAITGQDTVKLNDRLISDLGDGDVGALTHPNDLVTVKAAKNGNVLFALNAAGVQCELVIRVMRGSADDKFLNQISNQIRANLPGFVLMTGELLKKVGDGKGNIAKDTYVLSGGVISKGIDATSNVEGNTDQGMAVYTMRFGKAIRMIQ